MTMLETSCPPRAARSSEVNSPYASRQRAGAAACGVAETGAIDPDLGSELESTLAGEWTLCSGELLDGYEGLRFDGQGAVTFLANGGQAAGSESYEALHALTDPTLVPRRLVFVFPGNKVWTVMFSERPLKLWVEESGPRTTGRVAIFSPLP